MVILHPPKPTQNGRFNDAENDKGLHLKVLVAIQLLVPFTADPRPQQIDYSNM
jgi:hypothetical protein